MFLLKRFSPYLIIILNIGVLEILLKKPTLIFWLAPVLTLFILVLIWVLAEPLGRQTIGRFVLKYFLLEVALIVSLVFLENNTIKQLLIAAATLALALHQEYLFKFLYRPEKYRTYSLENLTSSINFLTILLSALGIFGLMVFMNMIWWLALIFTLVMTGACFTLFLTAVKIEIGKNKWFMMMVTLITAEFFIILSWLPFNFYLKALLFSTLYYLMADLSRHIISKTATTKKVFWPIFICGVLWLVLFMTARWT